MRFFFMSYVRGFLKLLSHNLVPMCGFLSAGVMLAQNCPPGELRVIVVDSQESPVRDASVKVEAGANLLGPRSTQTTGLADFETIPCGSWIVTVTSADFETVTQAIQIG